MKNLYVIMSEADFARAQVGICGLLHHNRIHETEEEAVSVAKRAAQNGSAYVVLKMLQTHHIKPILVQPSYEVTEVAGG